MVICVYTIEVPKDNFWRQKFMKIRPSKDLEKEIEAEIQRAKASESEQPNIADILASGNPPKEGDAK